jgi:hypothetical protein
MKSISFKAKERNLLRALAEGVSAFLTYEARCGMYPAYCEQFIYGPIVRIAKQLGWSVMGEVPVGQEKDGKKKTPGDFERVDFVLGYGREGHRIAIEVKYLKPSKKQSLSVKKDVDKLQRLIACDAICSGYIFVVGRYSGGSGPRLSGHDVGDPTVCFSVPASRTQYGASAYCVGG